MSDGNRNAGREALPAGPERPSITSPAELAVHLGRELSASAVDDNGWTDLHYAAALDWPAVARVLLGAGARLDARLRADRVLLGPGLLSTLSGCGQDRFTRFLRTGATPLHIAAFAGACEVVAVLLRGGGADPDDADARTARPLHYAAAGHSGSAAAVLAAHGADVGAATAKGVTPLHAAARRDAVSVVRVLLDHGAAAEVQDTEGDTPLHRAASGDAASVAAVLLDHGVDVSARAGDGATPLHVAALKKADRVVQVLLGRGANLSACAEDGSTPLHAAALRDAAGVLSALLSHGADLNPPTPRATRPCTGRRRATPWPRSKCCWPTGQASMLGRTTAASRWMPRRTGTPGGRGRCCWRAAPVRGRRTTTAPLPSWIQVRGRCIETRSDDDEWSVAHRNRR